MPISPARAAAFEILIRVATTGAYASELLHSSRFARLSPNNHGLATELVMGVLRWRSLLDAGIGQLASQPLSKLDCEVLTSLRMGAYQLSFLHRIPQHAAIHESVELVKTSGKRSASGVVNAVLRKLVRTGAIPSVLGEGGPLGEPGRFEASHPQWMVERWGRIYGAETAHKICEYNQSPPESAIRVSKELSIEGIELVPGALLTGTARVKAGEIARTESFREGRIIIQDEASQLVALLADGGRRILDCCAAPGGKTRIIASRAPDAAIVAMELHPHRARLLRRLVREKNVEVIAADARRMPFAGHFDRILVDAPCSGTGTLARNPEIKWRLSADDLPRLQEYQLQILRSALAVLSPGGRIIYSTCSLEPEENQHAIEHLIATSPLVQIVDCGGPLRQLQKQGELAWSDVSSLMDGPFLRTLPGVHPGDGFFAAILERVDGN
jgi:16S rRNA (cytosine967-C5)-methyltransferase